MKKKIYKKKSFWILVSLILLLVSIRLLLPTVLKNYVNKTLANIPEYYGQVDDIDISLLRGAYTIHGMYLNKVNAKTQVPFLDLKKIDISLEWKSLLKGKIVSEIIMDSPSIIYVFEDHKSNNSEEAALEDWTTALTNLVPIDINDLNITNGKIAFVQVYANPNIDLQINNITLNANNLKNVSRNNTKLPSTLKATGNSIGNGKVILTSKLDLIKRIPDVDLSLSLKDANITSLNDLTKYYAGIDFNKGSYGVFSEIAINDGYLKGYLKPVIKNAKLIGKEDDFANSIWEGFVGFFKFILKNQKQNTLATKVPLEGDLNNVNTKVVPSLVNIIKNGWIKAFKEITDDSIEFEDAQNNQ